MKILRLGFGVEKEFCLRAGKQFKSPQGKTRGTFKFRVLDIHHAYSMKLLSRKIKNFDSFENNLKIERK
jgi:hypothetical protein